MDEWFEKVSVLELKPGQIVLLQCEQRLTAEYAARISERAKRFFPDNQVMILDAGMKLEVVDRG